MPKKTYMLVIVDKPSQVIADIETENVKIDFVSIGELVHGRHWKGRRINVVVNRSSYRNLDEVEDERIASWWNHVKSGVTTDE